MIDDPKLLPGRRIEYWARYAI